MQHIAVAYTHQEGATTQMELKRIKAERKKLRQLGLNEKWLQDQIADDPSILGLGDEISVYKREAQQPTGGRIDFVLTDDEDQRFEVEIMLGATDPSHIIRTIEYWDVEKKHSPLKEHCAVLIAEEITSRFFNVISLLHRAVPIIAMQLDTLVFEDKVILHFTKVLDASSYFSEEDEDATVNAEPADISYWEKRASPKALEVTQKIIAMVPSGRRITYNKSHIAVATDGKQFAWLFPRRKQPFCLAVFNLRDQTDSVAEEAWVAKLNENDITATYKRSSIHVPLTESDLAKNHEIIHLLVDACVTHSH